MEGDSGDLLIVWSCMFEHDPFIYTYSDSNSDNVPTNKRLRKKNIYSNIYCIKHKIIMHSKYQCISDPKSGLDGQVPSASGDQGQGPRGYR